MALIKLNNRSSEDNAIHGRRNLIFNGAMQVWQRSTDDTESGTGWGYRHADRYYTNKGRYRKETATIDGREWDIMHIDDAGVGYNGGRGMIYKHEEYRDYANTLTLSFYAKASASSTVNVGASNFGGSQYASGTNITLTTDWVRYEIQITASPIPTQTGETYIINNLDDGIDYYITGIQLEVGEIATPFEHRSYGEELQLCQRYYERFGQGWWARFESGSQLVINGQFKVEKRTAPTIGLPTGGTIRLYEWGVSDRDATPSLTNTEMNANGGHFKLNGFSGGSTGEIWGVGGTDSDFSEHPFEAKAEL